MTLEQLELSSRDKRHLRNIFADPGSAKALRNWFKLQVINTGIAPKSPREVVIEIFQKLSMDAAQYDRDINKAKKKPNIDTRSVRDDLV